MQSEERVEAIRALLSKQLNPSILEIEDDSAAHAGPPSAGGAGPFNIKLASSQFEDKTLIQQHRLVYAALDEMMESDIHALSIQVVT
jgi:BolA protein